MSFWSWFLTWRLVRPIGVAAEAIAFLYVVIAWWRTSRDVRLALKPLLAPTLLVFSSTLLILAATFAYGGEDVVFITAGSRFSHPLPGDNALPYTLAYSMMKYYRVPIPIQLDWLSSDRPPLQTAIVLSQYFALIWPIAMGYQVLCMILQTLWLFGFWLLLSAFRIGERAMALILAGCLFSSFTFVNTAFVWPKLLAAAYLMAFAALLVSKQLERHSRYLPAMAITAGMLLAWSLLSHGGTVFAFGGLAFLAIYYRRSFNFRGVAILLVTAVLLYVPWILYQKLYDPPGTRLIKMHIAGVEPIDKRGVLQTISDSYRALSMKQIVDYKSRNLTRAFTTFQFWPVLGQMLFELPKTQPERSQSLVAIARNLNAAEFFFFPSTAGLLLPGLLFLGLGVFARFRSREWLAGVILLAFAVFTNVFFSFVMFVPDTTSVHAGAYMAVLAYFAACILGWWVLSRWAAVLATLLQIALFVYTNAFVLSPPKIKPHSDVVILLVLAVVGTIYFLTRLETSEGRASGAVV